MEPIETQSPAELPSLKKRLRELAEHLREISVEGLRSAYKSLFGTPAEVTYKNELIDLIAEKLNFATVAEFREWFFALPVLTRDLLSTAAFTDYVPIRRFEAESDRSLLVKTSAYSRRTELRFNPVLRLDFLPISIHYGCPVTFLPTFLRTVLSRWLAPPRLYQVSARRLEEPPPPEEVWDNSPLIGEIFPLLCDTIRTVLERVGDEDWEKLARGGFKKRDLAELRASTGFQPFRISGDCAPDSVDLAARFMLCMFNYQPQCFEDGYDEIRKMMQAFFNLSPRYAENLRASDRRYLEYMIGIDHLSRTAGNYLEHSSGLPLSRKVFYGILLEIAQDGGWFDADKIAEYIRITGKDFSFCDKNLERSLKVKADTLWFEGLLFNAEHQEFHPEGILRHTLLVRPLFKAYCYIFAVFGLLEITQANPPLYRRYHDKQYPVSPYDSLKAARITSFGLWCLGLTDARPPRPLREYRAIADRELFLVTVQGDSLERRVYLDKIGQPLGEDRWRISPASFIAGCINLRQISERIERFKLLIDPNPAPHWEELFKKVLGRAALFDQSRTDMLVYDLPADPETAEEILRDPEIRRITRRVEGRLLALHVKDQRAFYLLLSEHGIAHF
ncbi:MAG: hypothetical protein LBG73_05070 [Spirochaetaceae bacterium]|jgi:hypothetical protein|nr:hypothetical protein [Spirochaetaceae bacterium]